jgi:hypothetical protein
MEDECSEICSGDQLVTPDNGERDSLENVGMFFLLRRLFTQEILALIYVRV